MEKTTTLSRETAVSPGSIRRPKMDITPQNMRAIAEAKAMFLTFMRGRNQGNKETNSPGMSAD